MFVRIHYFFMVILLFTAGLTAQTVRVAVLGDFPEGKSPETMAAKIAFDHVNTRNATAGSDLKFQMVVYNDHAVIEKAVETAQRLAKDPLIKVVVVHGETSVAPEVLGILKKADLAVIAASSWQTKRPEGTDVTWLSPSQNVMAEISALYARKPKGLKQVAVVDNGSATSVAAAQAFAERFKKNGGRVVYSGEWQGSEWGLTRTVKDLAPNWPQAVFYAGNAVSAGQLVKTMKKEKELAPAVLLGLPQLFEKGFFDEARTQATRSAAVFPYPDYQGFRKLQSHVGLAFKKGTPNWKAYYGYSWKKPGRWTSLVFDAVTLAIRAVEKSMHVEMEDDPEVTNAGGEENGAIESVLTEGMDEQPLEDVPVESAENEVVVSRKEVKAALLDIHSIKGIRGWTHFSENRQPKEEKAMIFYAQPEVNSTWMKWWDFRYGPPWPQSQY